MTTETESTMPTDIGIIDTLLGIPSVDKTGAYDWLRPLLRDAESLDAFDFPVQYQYHALPDVPKDGTVDDMIDFTVEQMDRHNIRKALLNVSLDADNPGRRAMERYPDRFFGSISVDPNRGVPALRELQLPGDVLILSIRRAGEFIVPRGNTQLEYGDHLTLVGTFDHLHEARALFG